MLHLANLLNSVCFLIFVSVYSLLFSAREQKAKVKWLIKNQSLNNDEILTLVAFISHSHFSIILSSRTFRDIYFILILLGVETIQINMQIWTKLCCFGPSFGSL